MKKRLLQIFTCVLLLVLMVGSTVPASAATLKLSNKSITVQMGKTFKLTVANAGSKTITWSSSDKKVATVTTKGVVKGIKVGTATITAKVGSTKLTCTVKVQDPAALNYILLNLNAGKTKTLKVKGLYDGRTVSSWTSSKSKYATVDSNGKVTAIKEGTTIVTAKLSSGKKLKATVNVKEAAKIVAPSTKLLQGEKMTLKIENRNGRAITWKSSDTSIATVSTKGVVKGKSVGKVTITAAIENSKKITKEIEVYPAVTLKELSLAYDNSGNKVVRYSLINNMDKEVRFVGYELHPFHGTTALTDITKEFNASIVSKNSKTLEDQVDVSTSLVKFEVTEVVFADGSTWAP